MSRLRVTREDRKKLLGAVVEFANLPRIETTEQVETLFSSLPGVGPYFRVLPAGEADAYVNDQRDLRAWLTAISAGRGAKVADAVSDQLGTLDVAQRFDPRRRELVMVSAIQGVQAALAYGAALLLDRSIGLTKRLGQCGAPGCGRFRLDFNESAGRPRRHCSEAHRRRANNVGAAETMREYRATKKAGGLPRNPRRAVPKIVPAATRNRPKTSQRQPTTKRKTPR